MRRMPHAQHLECIFRKLREAGFTVNPNKVQIACTEIKLLGHLVTQGDVRPDP
jgi:predicted nucleic acid-binding protein